MGDEDLADLGRNIKEHGLQHPVELQDGKVLEGRNRIRACALVDVTPTFVRVSVPSPTLYLIQQNVMRLHLTADQKAALAEQLRPQIEREMRGRMAEGGRRGAQTRADRRKGSTGKGVPKSGTPSGGGRRRGRKTRDVLASTLHVSKDKVDEAHRLKAEDPARFERVRAGQEPLPAQAPRESINEKRDRTHFNNLIRWTLDDFRALRAHQDADIAGLVSSDVRDDAGQHGREAVAALRRLTGVLCAAPPKRSAEETGRYLNSVVRGALGQVHDLAVRLREMAAEDDGRIVEMVDASTFDRVRVEGPEAVATLQRVISLFTAEADGQTAAPAIGTIPDGPDHGVDPGNSGPSPVGDGPAISSGRV